MFTGRPRSSPDPKQPSSEPIAHWVSISSHGRLLEARTLRTNGDYRAAAAITVLFANELIHYSDGARTGIFDPHEILTLDQLEPDLKQARITIHTEESHELPPEILAQLYPDGPKALPPELTRQPQP